MARISAQSMFTAKFDAEQTPLGTFVLSIDPAATAAIASAGHDFVIIDREHGPNDVQSTANHIRAAEANDTVPIVRVLANDPTQIQQALDVGAHGIMVPKVDSAQEARALVRATRYTSGGRGMCPATEGARWSSGDDWLAIRENSNTQVVAIPLIETRSGIDNLADIVAVDGIEMVFFGMADLSQDLGLDMYTDGPKLIALWEQAVSIVHAAGKKIGAPNGFGFTGSDYGTVGSDLGLMKSAAAAGLAQARQASLQLA